MRGGGPGTRETALLDPAQTVEGIDAIALSGGSAFGLDAAAGVQAWLAEQGRGFAVRTARVPIVPGAILFDLLNGGDKDWGRFPPYRELGYAAAAAAGDDFRARHRRRRASAPPPSTSRAASARPRRDRGGHHGRRARRRQRGRQRHGRRRTLVLGGAVGARRRIRRPRPAVAVAVRARWPAVTKGTRGENTTLAVVATDAVLNKAQAKRLAVMAQTGIAHAVSPVHTPLDGDMVFAVATGRRPLPDPIHRPGRAWHRCRRRTGPGGRARRSIEATALPFPERSAGLARFRHWNRGITRVREGPCCLRRCNLATAR